MLNTYIDPFLRVTQPEDITWRSMGEGPHARAGMEALGMKMGPAFPAHQPLSKDSIRQRVEDTRRAGCWNGWTGKRNSGSGIKIARSVLTPGHDMSDSPVYQQDLPIQEQSSTQTRRFKSPAYD
jgi:hypothetical protein